MEKRTLLAFVLSFAVIIGWSLIFTPQQSEFNKQTGPFDKELLHRQPEELQSPDLPQQNKAFDESLNTTRKTSSSIDQKDIIIDTPLYRAVFTNAGPTIRSFKLKKYFTNLSHDSEPIELVKFENDLENLLTIDFHDYSKDKKENLIYETNQTNINLRSDSPPKELVFHTISPRGLLIKKTFCFFPDRYQIDIKFEITNQSDQTLKGSIIAQLKNLPPEEKHSYYSFIGFTLLLDNDLQELKYKDDPAKNDHQGLIDWIAYEDDYFISAIVPNVPVKSLFRGQILPGGILEGTYIQPSISLDKSQHHSTDFIFYMGPRDLTYLKEIGKKLERSINFGWTDIIARPLLYMLRFFNTYINNYGISIILLTILIKIFFWPLTHKSYQSMKEMQKLQPIMAKIREKHKNDKQKMNAEIMGLYKTYKVNPMGGCLPMVVQIPVFFALFRILGSTIELRHASFMLWINDLSAPDRLFNFPFEIPFMTSPSGIPILTLLMGASMFIQQKMTPAPGDPTQAKMMMFLPVIFTFMFINFPSGLVLYWLINNLLSIAQQYRIYKKSR